MSIPRMALITSALIVALFGYSVVGLGRVVLNGSESLPHHGYFMVTWPKIFWRGCYVAFEPPEDISDRFQGLFFVKEVVGLPGDSFENTSDSVCVMGACRKTVTEDGAPVAPLLSSGSVPDASLFVLGETAESLDSRYEVVGAIDRDDVVAVGIPIPLLHWKELQKWLGR